MITQDELKKLLHYDPDSGEITWIFKIAPKINIGEIAGCICKFNGKKYRKIRILGKYYLAHRLAILWMTGSFPKNQGGHNDGDGTNNKWSNLCQETQSQNMKNTRLSSANTSGFCGVHRCSKTGRWVAEVRVERKKHSLGRFINKDDAIAARKSANKLHGFHAGHGLKRDF